MNQTTSRYLPKRMAFLFGILFSFASVAQNLVITTQVCNQSASQVRLTGPWWGWDPNGGPVAVDNGNGTWIFTMPAPTANMEYLLVVDGVLENLIPEVQSGNGACAPITDGATYANRQWLTSEPLTINNTYGQCSPCTPAASLSITVAVCDSASEVRMTGPFWSWDPNGGPFASDNGDGTWTFNFAPAPTTSMEYLIIVDGVQENLIQDVLNGGSCAPVTDYSSYANRVWNPGGGDVTGISYDRCVSCDVGDLVITTEICDSTLVPNQLSLTGPIWNWNTNYVPNAVNNGNGTWTFTFAPAPADSFEYLLVFDGFFENLVTDMINGGTCAPITDYSTFASRLWVSGNGDVQNIFDQCNDCSLANIDETEFRTLTVFPNPTTGDLYLKDEKTLGQITITSILGEKLIVRNIIDFEGSIPMEGLSSGVYYLTVLREGSSFVQQILKQ